MTLTREQEDLCASNTTDFSDLSAIFLNCTLKTPDHPSHTELMMSNSAEIMGRNGVFVELVRVMGIRSPSASIRI